MITKEQYEQLKAFLDQSGATVQFGSYLFDSDADGMEGDYDDLLGVIQNKTTKETIGIAGKSSYGACTLKVLDKLVKPDGKKFDVNSYNDQNINTIMSVKDKVEEMFPMPEMKRIGNALFRSAIQDILKRYFPNKATLMNSVRILPPNDNGLIAVEFVPEDKRGMSGKEYNFHYCPQRLFEFSVTEAGVNYLRSKKLKTTTYEDFTNLILVFATFIILHELGHIEFRHLREENHSDDDGMVFHRFKNCIGDQYINNVRMVEMGNIKLVKDIEKNMGLDHININIGLQETFTAANRINPKLWEAKDLKKYFADHKIKIVNGEDILKKFLKNCDKLEKLFFTLQNTAYNRTYADFSNLNMQFMKAFTDVTNPIQIMPPPSQRIQPPSMGGGQQGQQGQGQGQQNQGQGQQSSGQGQQGQGQGQQGQGQGQSGQQNGQQSNQQGQGQGQGQGQQKDQNGQNGQGSGGNGKDGKDGKDKKNGGGRGASVDSDDGQQRPGQGQGQGQGQGNQKDQNGQDSGSSGQGQQGNQSGQGSGKGGRGDPADDWEWNDGDEFDRNIPKDAADNKAVKDAIDETIKNVEQAAQDGNAGGKKGKPGKGDDGDYNFDFDQNTKNAAVSPEEEETSGKVDKKWQVILKRIIETATGVKIERKSYIPSRRREGMFGASRIRQTLDNVVFSFDLSGSMDLQRDFATALLYIRDLMKMGLEFERVGYIYWGSSVHTFGPKKFSLRSVLKDAVLQKPANSLGGTDFDYALCPFVSRCESIRATKSVGRFKNIANKIDLMIVFTDGAINPQTDAKTRQWMKRNRKKVVYVITPGGGSIDHYMSQVDPQWKKRSVKVPRGSERIPR